MPTVTVTNEQVIQFRRNQELYSRGHAAQFRPFLYALNKMYAKTKSIEDDILEKEREIDIKHCTKDKDGYAVMEKSTVKVRGLNGETKEEEQQKLKFTTQALLESGKEKKALLQATVEIEAHHTDDIPDDFDFSWWRVFSPFVLPEEIPEDTLQKLYERGK